MWGKELAFALNYAEEAQELIETGRALIEATGNRYLVVPPFTWPPECPPDLYGQIERHEDAYLLLHDRLHEGAIQAAFPHLAALFTQALAIGYAIVGDTRANPQTVYRTGVERIGHGEFFDTFSRDFARYADHLARDRATTAAAMALRLGYVRPAQVLGGMSSQLWIMSSRAGWYYRLLGLGQEAVLQALALVHAVATWGFARSVLPQLPTAVYASLPLRAARPPPEPRTPQFVALVRAVMTAAPPVRFRVRPCG